MARPRPAFTSSPSTKSESRGKSAITPGASQPDPLGQKSTFPVRPSMLKTQQAIKSSLGAGRAQYKKGGPVAKKGTK